MTEFLYKLLAGKKAKTKSEERERIGSAAGIIGIITNALLFLTNANNGMRPTLVRGLIIVVQRVIDCMDNLVMESKGNFIRAYFVFDNL